MSTCRLEYSPYTVPLSKVLEIANRITSTRKTRTLASALLKNQKLVKRLPEDLRELVYAAELREIAEKGKGSDYLAGKLKKNKIFLVRLLRLIDTHRFLSESVKLKKEIIEFSEPGYVRVCILHYPKPFFDFQRQNPVSLKVNRKSKSVLLQVLGTCSDHYSSTRRSKRSDVTLNKTVVVLKDFPGILITFHYDIHRRYYHSRYGSALSSYSRVYGVMYSFFTGNIISFRLKSDVSRTTVETVETAKELLKLIPSKEKGKINVWIKRNAENLKLKSEKERKKKERETH